MIRLYLLTIYLIMYCHFIILIIKYIYFNI